MKRIVFLLFVAAALTTLPSSAQIWDPTAHECQSPSSHEVAIHEAHGELHCGNIDENGVGQPETCTQEILNNNGQLNRGEWLACGEHSGPSGGRGCSWDIVQRCGGRIQSGNVSAPISYDGSYSRCRIVTVLFMPSGQTQGYECSWRTNANNEYFHTCYCGSDGVLFCQ